jgi:hypothetical protein
VPVTVWGCWLSTNHSIAGSLIKTLMISTFIIPEWDVNRATYFKPLDWMLQGEASSIAHDAQIPGVQVSQMHFEIPPA